MPPPGEPDPYAALARFYDLDHADFDADLDFWRNLAKIVDGPVLEIGSGTGRVLFPLARSGVEVVEVEPGGAAARAGIRPEDILLEVDGRPIDDVGDLQRLMVGERIGGRVRVRLFRRGEELDVSVVPDELSG